MSSDGYFDDDLDPAAFEQLDAIEAALLSPRLQAAHRSPPPLTKERSFYDLTFDIDETELQRLDEFIEDTYQGKAQPVAGPSKSTSMGTRQTTLFGHIIPSQSSSAKPRSQIKRTKSTPRNPFGQQAPKTKQWDQTAFARTGPKRGNAKGKGKTNFDEEEEESVEFEQFPAPFVSSAYILLPFSSIILKYFRVSWVSRFTLPTIHCSLLTKSRSVNTPNYSPVSIFGLFLRTATHNVLSLLR
jgi:ATP-dependent DNA helicase MPH1